jgi:hypothetical protein
MSYRHNLTLMLMLIIKLSNLHTLTPASPLPLEGVVAKPPLPYPKILGHVPIHHMLLPTHPWKIASHILRSSAVEDEIKQIHKQA